MSKQRQTRLQKDEKKLQANPLTSFAQHAPLLWRATMMSTAIRVVFLILAYVAGRLFLENTAPIESMFNEVLVRWDAAHYVYLAEQGYTNVGDARFLLVFLPLYPLVVSILRVVTFNTLLAGLLVSFASSVAAGYFLQKLAKMDGDNAYASRALVFFFLFPTAFFLFLPYTEALFMALSLGSFYFARENKWTHAGVLGMLAAATRLQGILLLPALLIEALHQKKITHATAILLVPLGLLAYLTLNIQVSGQPFKFIEYQNQHWFHSFIWPQDAVLQAAASIANNAPSVNRFITSEALIASTLLVAGLLILGRNWLRPSYQAYSWLMLAALLSISWQISMPRYVLSIFPIFFVLARASSHKTSYWTAAAASGMLMGGLFFIYATGRWAF